MPPLLLKDYCTRPLAAGAGELRHSGVGLLRASNYTLTHMSKQFQMVNAFFKLFILSSGWKTEREFGFILEVCCTPCMVAGAGDLRHCKNDV